MLHFMINFLEGLLVSAVTGIQLFKKFTTVMEHGGNINRRYRREVGLIIIVSKIKFFVPGFNLSLLHQLKQYR
jgi:UPF0716 family protein affecting phage T7 exclusion